MDDDELPDVFPPYLPPVTKDTKPYCLVLDLDETLIHFVDEREEKGDEEGDVYYMVRPGMNKFLSTLAQYWELVVYTAAMQDYADWILNEIDTEKHISHRLYR